MSNANPIDLLFGDMEKLGPGSNSDTLKVLDMLPKGFSEFAITDCKLQKHLRSGQMLYLRVYRRLDALLKELILKNIESVILS